jgi:hypothetical protein
MAPDDTGKVAHFAERIHRMIGNWRRTLIVGTVLVATHAASAVYYANRYSSGVVRTSSRAMTLDLTPDQWAGAAVGADSTTYLRVAQNVADGMGVVATTRETNPPHTRPFIFWGPGTPVVLGLWLKFLGGRTMLTFFMFAVVAQLVAGALAVATAAQWTRGTVALSLVAFCSGYCPPLQEWFYGIHLTSSEIVALPILALLFFALSKAFLAWADRGEDGSPEDGAAAASRRAPFWRRFVPGDSNRQVWLWFAFAGVLIGCASLSRDCVRVFAPFVAVYLVARTAAVDRRRLLTAIAVGGVLLAGTHAVRYPVQLWNKYRAARSTVCVASEGCIWRYGLWMKHDDLEWYKSVGIGFGEYLDPEAALRVNAYYQSGKPRADSYSMAQLAQAVWKRPIDALAFKIVRLPALWLGTDMWPNSALTRVSVWSLGMYAILAVFCVVQRLRRRTVPEVLYLYLLLILFASALIHFEFRYTFPIWNTLILSPGLLRATLTRQGWQPALLTPKPADSKQTAMPQPTPKAIAA